MKSEMKDMDLALDDLYRNKNQQLRDSISSIVSIDRSATGSGVDTPRSSPSSSVVMGPTNGRKGDLGMLHMNGASRRSSVMSSTTTRETNSKRNFSLPPAPVLATQLPRKTPLVRSTMNDFRPVSGVESPSPYSQQTSVTPTPISRQQRPSTVPSNNKPRWNSSPKVDHIEFPKNFKSLSLNTTTPPSRNNFTPLQSPHSFASNPSTNLPLPSPLGRADSSSPAPTLPTLHRPRLSSGAQNARTARDSRQVYSSPARPTQSLANPPAAAHHRPSTSFSRRAGNLGGVFLPSTDESSTCNHISHPSRPVTSLSRERRISMLPVPKAAPVPGVGVAPGREGVVVAGASVRGGREITAGVRIGGRDSILGKGERERQWK
jgi:hypothetical protein